MNFVKNPYNVKSGKYTPHPKRFHSPNTLPFPCVFMAFHETENLQLCSSRKKTPQQLSEHVDTHRIPQWGQKVLTPNCHVPRFPGTE